MRPHPRRARTDPQSPRGWATDDRSGFVGNHENLQWQMEWGGFKLYSKRILVYPDMYDKPQEQLRSIIIPPDPQPLMNARPENYTYDEWTFRLTQSGQQRFLMNGTPRVESNVQANIGLTDETGQFQLTSEDGMFVLMAG
jgi:hypothetical protein